MKIFLEQDDIFQAVREYLERQGMSVPPEAGYNVDKDASGSVFIEIPGVTRMVLQEPTRPTRQKTATSVVEGVNPAVSAAERQALDPGEAPPADDTGVSLDDIRDQNVALSAKAPARSGGRRRRNEAREMPFDDMGKDPTDMSDEL